MMYNNGFDRVDLYKSIIELSADAITTSNLNGIIKFVSPKTLELHGFESPEELVGKPAFELIAKDQWGLAQAGLQEALNNGYVRDLIYNMVRKDGSMFVGELNAILLRDKESKPVGFMATTRDITERIEAEKSLRSLEQQLLHAQKMELIGRLASGVAHSFNNLLTIIKGFAATILIQNGNVPYKSELKEIESAASKAAAVVKQLLVFSRKQDLKLEEIDVNYLVNNLSKMLLTLIGSRVKIVYELEEGLGKIKADAVQLEQVLINLVANAKDAMEQGGKLTIKTRSTSLVRNGHPLVDIPSGEYIQISVMDEGCGMSKEVLNHIFEPFFTTKDPGKGTGLGLSTAYGIVKSSGGYIFAESEVGKGSTFNLFFPRI